MKTLGRILLAWPFLVVLGVMSYVYAQQDLLTQLFIGFLATGTLSILFGFYILNRL